MAGLSWTGVQRQLSVSPTTFTFPGWLSLPTTPAEEAPVAAPEPAAADDTPDPAAVEVPRSWPPRAPELTWWPIERRQRWGERANELEASGLPWQAAERQAFDEIKAAMTKEHR